MFFKTLSENIHYNSTTTDKGITFIDNKVNELFLSYKDFYHESRLFLFSLQEKGINPGDELVFLLEDNKQFLVAFWACILGGIKAVPVAPAKQNEHKLKFFKIWDVLTNPFLITTRDFFTILERFSQKKNISSIDTLQKKTIFVEKIKKKNAGKIYKSNPDDIAFIQFSSGSTGTPKGVVLTHRNITENTQAIKKQARISQNDSMLSWLPLTHDMGLILAHLSAVYTGINQVIMPTALFIQDPDIWFDKTSQHKSTILYSSNFGFNYFHKLFSGPKKWDLSPVRLIYNGGEPISHDVCTHFLESLASYGLKKTVMYPGFGMAEATVGVTFPQKEEEVKYHFLDRTHLNVGNTIIEKDKSAVFADLGQIVDKCHMRICDDNDIELGENTIGHLQLKGKNITRGYYNNEQATKDVFTRDNWLRTGDIGFIQNNRLTITGRAKEILFVQGKNYYAEDIERIARIIKELDIGKIVAAGVYNDKIQKEEILFFILFSKRLLSDFCRLSHRVEKIINRETGIKIDHIIPVPRIPITTSGKKQRFKLRQDYLAGKYDEVIKEIKKITQQIEKETNSNLDKIISGQDRESFAQFIKLHVEKILGYEITDCDETFRNMGINSLKIIQVKEKIENVLNLELTTSFVLDYPTLKKMTRVLEEKIFHRGDTSDGTEENKEYTYNRETTGSAAPGNKDIAVIGIACRFPGNANTPEQFWNNLINHVNPLQDIPFHRWEKKEVNSALKVHKGYFLEDIDTFPAAFFNISPTEAATADPQQRLLLETSWEAFENAGINTDSLLDSKTGVFIGISTGEYANLTDRGTHGLTGSLPSAASGRLSFFYGLQGPSISIDTACSSSLVAIHSACTSLLSNECNLALCGGVNLITGPAIYMGLQDFGALSPDGTCKTFDNRANGYGRGEGCALLILKKVTDALHDNDNILGVIKGTGVNHDGRSSGLTVPNGKAQELVIKNALKKTSFTPDTIDYIETHGTGTKIGDPQEINALVNIFGKKRNKDLLIGSVKTNIGHLETAAGIAGFIKVLMSLQHKTIPGQLHFQSPSTYIPWKEIPVKVVDSNIPWKKEHQFRRAGISSFGISGTNAHVIIEEYQQNETTPVLGNSFPEYNILAFSAKTESELQKMAGLYYTYLKETDESIENICYTSLISRTSLKKRLLFLGKTKKDFITVLKSYCNNTFSEDKNRDTIAQIFSSLEYRKSYHTLIKQYLNGEKADLGSWYSNKFCKKSILPNYPFEKESYWAFPLKKADSSTEQDNVDKLIYSVDWVHEENTNTPGINPRDLFCIFTDNQGIGQAMKNYIKSKNGQSIIIKKENLEEQLAETINTINTNEYHSISMVYLYALDIPFKENEHSDTLKKKLEDLYSTILFLLRSLLPINNDISYKLWIITQNCMMEKTASVPNVLHASLWGFGASLDHELPENWGGLIDIADKKNDGATIKRIITEITSAQDNRIGFTGGKRYVQRLYKTEHEAPQEGFALKKDAAYIITGGMGNIGYRLAQWLLEKGAGHLWLTGRSELTVEKEKKLNLLKSEGITIEYVQCDASSEQQVSQLLEQIPEEKTPLKGIIHAAGISSIIFAIEHTWEDFWNILSPKVSGTWNLYHGIKKRELDFFITISSVSSFSGVTGISAYSAANEFLNSFASLARTKDLPVTSINLGLWGEKGGMNAGALFTYLLKMGLSPINIQTGIKAFERVIPSGRINPSVVSFNQNKLKQVLTKKQKQGVFKYLDRAFEKRNPEEPPLLSGPNRSGQLQKKPALISYIKEVISNIVGFTNSAAINSDTPFMELGVDSILGLKIIEVLNNSFKREYTPVILFNYTTVRELAAFLLENQIDFSVIASHQSEKTQQVSGDKNEKIAVIGMACRFPDAKTPGQFWQNLYNGIDSISEIPLSRWNLSFFYDQNPDAPGKMYTKHGGFINDIDLFDADFFEISPAEALEMDPQQRLLLEVSWHALENAGLDIASLRKTKTGVFIGITNAEYSQQLFHEGGTGELDVYSLTGSVLSAVCGKIAHFYDFCGPSMAIDTACSSSLVSINSAVQSLITGESNLVLAGGVNALTNPASYVALSKMKALSPDGKCKTFDDKANGYVRAEGCGLIVLKRLSDALRDGNRILGVIKGSAVNQNGMSAGKTAPNGLAQEKVIKEALLKSRTEPDDIDYIEVHGTGTSLGDPIELEALGNIFKNRQIPLLVGSVKTNIGHSESAAGIAGIIKVLLSFQEKVLPPSLHFHTPNRKINWNNLPIKVVKEVTDWHSHGKPRAAGVSSFGIFGTNAHIILEEFIKDENEDENVIQNRQQDSLSISNHILTLSAKNSKGLKEVASLYLNYLNKTEEKLEDICYSSHISRASLEKKAAFIGKNKSEITQKIGEYLQKGQQETYDPFYKDIKDNDGYIFFEFESSGLCYMKIGYQDERSMGLMKCDIHNSSEWDLFLTTLSTIFCHNVEIAWNTFHEPHTPQLVLLPYYPFEKNRYWRSKNNSQKGIVQNRKKEMTGYTEQSSSLLNDIKNTIKDLITANSGISGELLENKKGQHLFNLGFDSLLITMIRGRLNEKFNLHISADQMVSELNTFEKIVQYIQTQKNSGKENKLTQPIIDSSPSPVPEDKIGTAGPGEIIKGDPNILSMYNSLMREQLDIIKKSQNESFEIMKEQLQILKNASQASPSTLNVPSLETAGPVSTGKRNELSEIVEKNQENENITINHNREVKHAPLFNIDKEMVRHLKNEYKNLYKAGNHSRFKSSDKQLAYATLFYIYSAFEKLGIVGTDSKKIEKSRLEDPVTHFNIIPAYTRLFKKLFQILQHHNVLLDHNSYFEFSPRLSSYSIEEIEHRIQTDVPEFLPAFSLIKKCGKKLADILLGKSDYLSILFSNKDTILEQYYKTEPHTQLLHTLIGKSISLIMERFEGHKKVKVLELGAGTGSATQCILPELSPLHTDYYFTDIGSFFLIKAKQVLKKYNFIKYEKVDLNSKSDLAKMSAIKFDIIVISNVVHATPNISKTMKDINRLLLPEGILLMVDTLAPPCWLDIVFGLTRDWWNYEDTSLRKDSPLLSQNQWKNVLKTCGFSNFSFIPALKEEKVPRPFLILGHNSDGNNGDSPGKGGKKSSSGKKRTHFPMSSVQKRMFALSQTSGGDATYHISSRFDVKGNLDIERFKKAVNTVVQRHEMLRTGFIVHNSKFYQKVHKQITLVPDYMEAGFEKIETLMEKLKKNLKERYDFSVPPLMRITIVKIEDNRYVVLLDIHHLIVDATSFKVFMEEVLVCYNNKTLPDFPVHYKEYVRYEKAYLKSIKYKNDETYWTNKIPGEVPLLHLPLDFQRPNMQSFDGDMVSFYISDKKRRQLKQQGMETGTTLNVLLAAASFLLLYKLSGNDTILLGTLVSGRNNPKFEKTVGMFVNTIIFSCNASPDISLDRYIKGIKEDIEQSYLHQEYPYEHLVEKKVTKRDTSRNPLFDVMYAFENKMLKEGPKKAENGVEFSNFSGDVGDALFDLYIQAGEYRQGLTIDFKYNKTLFKKETIRRWTGYYRQILDHFLTNPDTLIPDIQLIPEEEKNQLLTGFNNTACPFPDTKTIHGLFEEQVQKSADRIAVTAPDKILHSSLLENSSRSLTYKELNRNANRVAHLLIQKGLTPDTIVGIMTERSLEMITGIMGILKAGGAYLPIDPNHPADRIGYMLEDSGTKLLLTHTDFGQNLSFEGEILYLDNPLLFEENEEFKENSTENPVTACGPHNLAYVIYTSGSTGKPKGTMIEHRSVINRLKWIQHYYPLTAEDTILQKTPYTFDVSVWELFWWAFEGAKLSFLVPGGEKDPSIIADEIERSSVTVMHFVPSMLSPFLEYVQSRNAGGKLSTLKQVFASGEALSAFQVNTFNRLLYITNRTVLTNLYGPTEATVDVSYFTCSFEQEINSVPIGKPIDNIKLYVLNDGMQLQPIGVAGQLCISGTGLARGYLNRPGLTEEKFVENPFESEGDYRRLYKTGDTARVLPDGNIQYLGRSDGQVKIRGNRIETGEIENVLQAHPGIGKCAVQPVTIDGDVNLCAYYTLNTSHVFHVSGGSFALENEQEVTELKEFLTRKLPVYMVPSYFKKLTSIPLTASGKTDRKKLPKPEQSDTSNSFGYEEAGTEMEKQIVKVWEKLLKHPRIGVLDNFFNLGGDSIKAVRLLNMLNNELSSELKVAHLYEYQTPRELADFVESREQKSSLAEDLDRVYNKMAGLKEHILAEGILENRDAIADIYPMSSIEKGMVFHSLKGAGKGVYHDQHVYTFCYEHFQPDLYKKAFSLLVDKHEILRTAFNVQDFEEPVQIVYKQIVPSIEEFNLTGKSREEQEKFVETFLAERRNYPFIVEEAPLWLLTLFLLGENRICVTWEFHHAILDGWSNLSLINELHETYLALLENSSYVPPEPVSTYKEHVARELAEPVTAQAVDFWKKKLAGYNRLDFSNMFPINRDSGSTGREIYLYDLGTPLLKELTGICAGYSMDIKSACFAAYLAAVSMFSYENDLTLGMVNHTRPVIKDSEKIVGCFLNTIPVRFQLDWNNTWKEYLLAIHTALMDLKPYEKVPLFEIARFSDEKHTKTPFFEALFNFFNFKEAKNLTPYLDPDFSVKGYEHTNTALDFNMNLTLDKFVIYFNYSRAVLNNEAVLSLCRYFERALKEMINNPMGKMDKNSILSRHEKDLLIKGLNNTGVKKHFSSLSVLFEEQAAKSPDLPVLIADSISGIAKKSYTYADLKEKSDRLAALLIEKGAAPGIFVGITLPRSVEMITAILAVLRTGAAYLPLDLKYPEERLRFMLKDSGAPLVVTTESFSTRLPSSVTALTMDTFTEEADYSNSSPYILYNTPYPAIENTAYLIYTSGSTGTPKGVTISHKNIHNYIIGIKKAVPFSPDKPVVSVTTNSFDIFVTESLLPLTSGFPVVLANEEEQRNPALLFSLLETYGVKMIQTTPSRMKLLFEEQNDPGLTDILVGGEAFPEDLLELLQQKTAAKLYNVYGPTETTVWSTIKEVTHDKSVTIGKPIANTEIYIVDSHDRLVAPGIFGHLLIGGAGVARGYYNRPGLTLERFIPSPFKRGEKLYKTGDLARWLPDGNLEFAGRIDRQVKIRGHRIEPGEIEKQLTEHKEVKECAVIVREGKEGTPFLCAYFVPAPFVPAPAAHGTDRQLTDSITAKWQKIWDNYYALSPEQTTFNTAGWTSSYTGKALAREEMEEWLSGTIERIKTLNPGHILEIGCGTGMILFTLMHSCTSYTAADIAGESVEYIRKVLEEQKGPAEKITLCQKAAHDFGDSEAGSYDLIILNSVIQYFPGAGYLISVIENALEVLTDNGCIFIGDVRNYDLMHQFHTSLVLYQSEQDTPLEEIKKRIKQKEKMEKELLLSPAFFYALQKQLTAIGHVEIRLKKSAAENEMSLFRYDVLLYKKRETPAEPDLMLDWQKDGLSLEKINTILESDQPGMCRITSIPSKKSAGIVDRTDFIQHLSPTERAGKILADLPQSTGQGFESADFARNMPEGYDFEPVWAGPDQDRLFTLLFYKKGPGRAKRTPLPALPASPETHPDWQTRYANSPEEEQTDLPGTLKRFVQSRLPDYMVPSFFIQMDTLPLTPNGKIDKNALPAPLTPQETGTPGSSPQNETEEKVTHIWLKVLDIPAAGTNTDFFETGGHSLNAISLASRIKQEFAVDIPLSYLFDFPTIREQSDYIIRIKAQKGEKSSLQSGIPQISSREYYELSAAQNRLFMLHSLEENSTAYNLPGAVEIKGPLDIERFRGAFEKIVGRHEALRTTFEIREGVPVQKIVSPGIFTMEHCIPEETAQITELLTEQVRPFNLSRLPLFRSVLFELAPDHFIFFMDIHHIITDGYSFTILIKELLEMYEGKEPGPVEIQYKEYTYWQKEQFQQEKLKKQEEYWLKRFSGELPVLDLPLDFKRPKVQNFRGNKYTFTINDELTAGLKELAAEQNVSLYMLLLALYTMLLSKYGNTEEVIIGSPSAGRNHHQLENCIGMFVNTLAIKNRAPGESTFTDFLQEVRTNAINAFENQDYQFDRLVDRLDLKRDLGRNPLFDTMFALQTIGKEHFSTGPIDFIPYDWDAPISLFDLSLSCWDMKKNIEASFEYCTALFKEETIRLISTRFQQLIKNVLHNKDQKIKDISMITPEEERALLLKGPAVLPDLNSAKTVLELIEKQAEQNPGNTALTGPSLVLSQKETSLTYGELFEQVINLAHILQNNRVRPGSAVGLITRRSVEMIISILAIQKAGAAYVPIDPDYPRERIQYIIEDSRLTTLLAGNVETFKLKSLTVDKIIDISTLTTSLITHHCLAEEFTGSAASLAYIIYTSGSTGKPKGVKVTRGNLAAYTAAFLDEFNLTAEDVVLQQASYSFDTFTEEVYPILMRGGKLAIAGKYQVLDIKELLSFMDRHKISLISCSPQLLHELNKRPPSPWVHTYISGGDVLKWEYYNKLVTAGKVYNTYGPTETTVCVSYHKCSPERTDNVPIGKPVAGYTAYIMDPWGHPVPEGIPGELWVGGPGVTAGYVERPELTREKFVTCPISPSNDQKKMYKTGDLVRLNSQKELEYLGRVDNQVKIRGFRIEPGEIANLLLTYPAIENVFINTAGEDENKYLTAYYCLKTDEEETPKNSDLRSFLLKELPEYMVPSYFICLETLPVTTHGKIDKKALPQPDQSIYTGTEYKAPAGETEQKIAALWSSVLNLEKISRDDNFFEMGGNSLKAISIVAGIDSEFDRKFPLVYFFKNPTITATAAYLTDSAVEYVDYLSDAPLLLNEEHKKKIFCFPPLAAYSIYYKRLAEQLEDYSVYSFGFIKSEDRIEKYADMITEMDPEGPYILMGYCSGANLAFEVTKELEKRGKKVSDIIMFDAARRTEKRYVYPFMIDGFMEEMKKTIESLPGKINTHTKEELVERSRVYYHYFQDLVNTDRVGAHIHQIMSEQDMHNNYGWDIATGKEYTIYQGNGIHYLMLEHENIKHNTAIVTEKILKKIP